MPFSGDDGDVDFSVLLLLLPSFSRINGDGSFGFLLCAEVIVGVVMMAFGCDYEGKRMKRSSGQGLWTLKMARPLFQTSRGNR